MKEYWETVLDFCQQTTSEVSNFLIRDFGQVSATRKADGTLVTESDRMADQAIRQAIHDWFPTHGVLTEETEHVFPSNDWCWIVDPIDGTTNFTRGIPIWGISLGLVFRGIPVFGYVYFPMFATAYHGYFYGDSGLEGPHQGAYCNGKPITTSSDAPSYNHLFNLCARSTHIMTRPFPCKLRLMGVASYNVLLVASGASLGGIEATPKVWDLAAAWVILLAAGGVIHTLDDGDTFPLQIGQNYGERSFACLSAGNEDLFNTFLAFVRP